MTRDRSEAQRADVTFLFGSMCHRAREVVTFLDELPRLCRGALVECRLGVSTATDHLVCVARLGQAAPEAARRRLAFWAWRLGGTATFGGDAGAPAPEPEAALRSCDHVLDGVAPGLLFGAARRLLGRFLGPSPELVRGRLVLDVALGTPEAAGMAFDRRAQSVFVPSPRSPPVGEAITLRLRTPGGEEATADGVVSRLRGAGEDAPGAPAGFVLGLVNGDERLVAALLRDLLGGAEQRRAPRYPAAVRATLSPSAPGAEEAGAGRRVVLLGSAPRGGVSYVENLSQGGAFVRTDAALPPGTKVRLDLELPGQAAGIAGTVVHAGEDGLGIRFDADRAGDAAVGAALEQVAVHKRRALVVDDDLLARRMMADALAARGFEVFAAADGSDGVRNLIDLLLGLDLLVIDLHMPGLDGEALLHVVRQNGGERDLTLVVMSGSVDEQVERRLRAAGADAVLGKGAGMPAIADAAVRIMLGRERAGRAEVRGIA